MRSVSPAGQILYPIIVQSSVWLNSQSISDGD